MPSFLSHSVAGLSIATAFTRQGAPRRFWVLAALCAIVPDIDALGRPLGFHSYENVFGGHRSFTHSLLFAALLGAIVAWGVFREQQWDDKRHRLFACFFLAAASHSVLDALTTYGEGVAFLAPLSTERFSFPWKPIGLIERKESPSIRLLALAADEILWVWLPSVLFALSVRFAQRNTPD